ncbi:hypothetical protein Tco_1244622 [Tanacetum coccineum]
MARPSKNTSSNEKPHPKRPRSDTTPIPTARKHRQVYTKISGTHASHPISSPELRYAEGPSWTSEAEEAFRKIKRKLQKLPTLTMPKEGEVSILCLQQKSETISSMLLVEKRGVQIPISYKELLPHMWKGKEEGAPRQSNELQARLTPTPRAWRLYLSREASKEGSGVGVILLGPVRSISNGTTFHTNPAEETKGALQLGPDVLRIFTDLLYLFLLKKRNGIKLTSCKRYPTIRYNANNQGRPFQRNNARGNVVARNAGAQECPQAKSDFKDSDYFKDTKATICKGVATTQENGVVLDEEQLLFLAGEQVTNFDDDVDDPPEKDLALNVDHIFEADQCDAFDSDVDEAPNIQTMFMVNLSSEVPNYDEAGPHMTQYSVMRIKNLETQLQEKDNVIRNLKAQVSKMNDRSCETYNAKDITRAHTSEKTSTMLNEIESLKAQLKSKVSCVTSDSVKPKVLAPDMKKQVTFNDKPGTSSSNTQKHEVHQKVQQTNVPVIHSTGVNTSTEASGSKPRSNTKKNRILPAKSENKKKVEDHPRTNKTPTKFGNPKFQTLHTRLFLNAGRTDRPMVSGLRLFKTYDGELVKAKEVCGKVPREIQASFFIIMASVDVFSGPAPHRKEKCTLQCALSLKEEKSSLPLATAVNAHVVPPGTSVSTTFSQDAPSTSFSPSSSGIQPPVIQHNVAVGPTIEDTPITEATLHPSNNPVTREPGSGQSSSGDVSIAEPNQVTQPSDHLKKWSKDHPLDNIIGNPSCPVSTRKQLASDALWCCFHTELSKVEPKNFKMAVTEDN